MTMERSTLGKALGQALSGAKIDSEIGEVKRLLTPINLASIPAGKDRVEEALQA